MYDIPPLFNSYKMFLHDISGIDTQFRRFFLQAFCQDKEIDDACHCPCAAQYYSQSVKMDKEVEAEQGTEDREYEVKYGSFQRALSLFHEVVGYYGKVDEEECNESAEVDVRCSLCNIEEYSKQRYYTCQDYGVYRSVCFAVELSEELLRKDPISPEFRS